ncbi:MAG: hypothetical protein HY791_23205 [Deltaproteobacteria bacterium]|nr:hypothetical protein [Deltaproteobacteria bacterium]
MSNLRLLRALPTRQGRPPTHLGEYDENGRKIPCVVRTFDRSSLGGWAEQRHAWTGIRHSNMISILDSGIDTSSGRPFVAIELRQGLALDAVVARGARLGRWPSRESTVLVGISALSAIAALAARLGSDDEAGRALRQTTSVAPDAIHIGFDGSVRLMATTGALSYLSPEQARGERFGVPAYVYQTAVLLFELLTRNHPTVLPGASQGIQVFERIAKRDGPRPDIASPLAEVIERSLRNKVTERPPLAELLAALKSSCSPRRLDSGQAELAELAREAARKSRPFGRASQGRAGRERPKAGGR